jgi:glycosyltransferase involved in cell wall biosynthesis
MAVTESNADLLRATGELPLPISVLIPARNESLNLRHAIESVAWADDVWVVDSGSHDDTAQLGTTLGAKVVQFEYSGVGPKKKNWALENLEFKHEWVLILDADERVTPELRSEIGASVGSAEINGYYLDREYVFMGRVLRCKRPDWNLRLFRRALGRYERLGTNVRNTGDNEVHEHVLLDGRVGYLRARLRHDDRRPLRAWLDNHNRYSDWEAEVYAELRNEAVHFRDLLGRHPVWRKRSLRRIWVRLPMRPLLRFFIFYVVRGGILDGRPGFAYSVLMGYYEFLISLKIRERRQGPTPSD